MQFARTSHESLEVLPPVVALNVPLEVLPGEVPASGMSTSGTSDCERELTELSAVPN